MVCTEDGEPDTLIPRVISIITVIHSPCIVDEKGEFLHKGSCLHHWSSLENYANRVNPGTNSLHTWFDCAWWIVYNNIHDMNCHGDNFRNQCCRFNHCVLFRTINLVAVIECAVSEIWFSLLLQNAVKVLPDRIP